jgi:hypothetical protein
VAPPNDTVKWPVFGGGRFDHAFDERDWTSGYRRGTDIERGQLLLLSCFRPCDRTILITWPQALCSTDLTADGQRFLELADAREAVSTLNVVPRPAFSMVRNVIAVQ